MRICRVATVPIFIIHHLRQQILATVEAGHEVHVVTSPAEMHDEVARLPGIHYHPINIERRITPLADLWSLITLWRYFRRAGLDLVHSTTPKAGLLCALAGLLAGVPLRLHTFTGQPWKELRGPVRWITKTCDWLIVRLNTQCYADSVSQQGFLIEQGIGKASDIAVLGPGSISGVDLAKFDRKLRDEQPRLRSELDMPADARIIGFVGRITRDKGICELVAAFERLQREGHNKLILLLVGPIEATADPLTSAIIETIRHNPAIHLVDYTKDPEKYLAITDIACLPSYREGFGSAVIEAAAMGVPTVATRITGSIDSIVDGQTGILVPVKDADTLATALGQLLADDARREAMGAAAYDRTVRLFSGGKINALLLQEYARLASDKIPRKKVTHKSAPTMMDRTNIRAGSVEQSSPAAHLRVTTVLVTGASGFVGAALVPALRQSGYRAVRMVRRDPTPGELLVPDLTNWQPDTEALAGIDCVVHLAARAHVMRERIAKPLAAYRQMNVEVTRKLTEAAVRAGVKRFVFVSSIRVNGDSTFDHAFTEDDAPRPEDAYGISKLEAEQAMLQVAAGSGLETVIVRPSLIYGPGVKGNFLTLMHAVNSGLPLPFASVRNRRSLLYVGNLVDALALCVRHPAAAGKTYLLTDRDGVSTPDLVRGIAKALGRPARLFPIPDKLLKTACVVIGKSNAPSRLLGSLQVDGGKIQRELGWQPRYDMSHGLQKTAEWYHRRHDADLHN